MLNIKKVSDRRGFTLVELMIALSVMSVILVISTIVLVQIDGIYDKGVTVSNLQDATRNIVSDVSSAIQFSGYAQSVEECIPSNSPLATESFMQNQGDIYNNCADTTLTVNGLSENAYCIGTVRYSFIVNNELDTNSNEYAVWRDNLSSQSSSCMPISPNDLTGDDGQELMLNHGWLTNFAISDPSGSGKSYVVDVGSAFGESNLLNLNYDKTICKSQLGHTSSEFCSTFSVVNTVDPRVVN